MKLDEVIEVLKNMIDVYGMEYEKEEIEALEIVIYLLEALCCINGLYKWED